MLFVSPQAGPHRAKGGVSAMTARMMTEKSERSSRLHPVSRRGVLELAASFGFLATVGNLPARAVAADGIVGAWSLVSFDVDEGKGAEKPRFGPNPVGYLIYSANARMAAVLAGTRRPALDSPAGTSASEEARTQALSNFLAYAGRYEIRGDRVFHHVEVSVFTNLMGVTLERRFALEGDTLTIRTVPPEIWGSSNVLVWKRA
jgi:hypothetical protein